MTTLEVEILAGETVIGTSQITAWDWGMAVAGGDFTPTENYEAERHASELEGEARLPEARLLVRTRGGERVTCELVQVTDWSKSVGDHGREVALYGLELADHFGGPPAYE